MQLLLPLSLFYINYKMAVDYALTESIFSLYSQEQELTIHFN
ncbi:hypothetical protein [Pseudoteredinibacter isoporae]|uniref:Uncharacterized protein n=1 Tax=Pseudoteredinibacter isoporae TaxID=570281 RepID=A0A7X0JXZ9_9GAMM|nr:hypothetical protein [Pseudoteredinibacter isoporae]MBB6523341.1 hypothetical protein [Pseudoteredinibacter isoporae]